MRTARPRRHAGRLRPLRMAPPPATAMSAPNPRPACSTPTSSRTLLRGSGAKPYPRPGDGSPGDAVDIDYDLRERIAQEPIEPRTPLGCSSTGAIVSSIAMCATCPVVTSRRSCRRQRHQSPARPIPPVAHRWRRRDPASRGARRWPGSAAAEQAQARRRRHRRGAGGRDGRGPRRWPSGRTSRPKDVDLHDRLAEVGLRRCRPTSKTRSTTRPVPDRLRRSPARLPPTAGLPHPGVLEALRANGITMATVELAVGLDGRR